MVYKWYILPIGYYQGNQISTYRFQWPLCKIWSKKVSFSPGKPSKQPNPGSRFVDDENFSWLWTRKKMPKWFWSELLFRRLPKRRNNGKMGPFPNLFGRPFHGFSRRFCEWGGPPLSTAFRSPLNDSWLSMTVSESPKIIREFAVDLGREWPSF